MQTSPLLSVRKMPPAYQIVNAPAANRPTLLRVLHNRFLLWLQDASMHKIRRAAWRVSCVIGVVLWFATPQFILGILYASATFHGYMLPKAASILFALFYGRQCVRWSRRLLKSRATGNQHTFEGLPIDELAGYLMESQRFTRDDAMRRLGISQPKHKKIAALLEQCGVLQRGECNALELRTISREQLVTQLRGLSEKKAAPLVHDETRNEWVERDGSFSKWILDRERGEGKRQEKLDRLERRIEKRRGELRELASPFTIRPLCTDTLV